MTEEEILARIRQMHIAELEAGDVGLWWLSFADEDGFRGVVIVEAYGFTDALHVSRKKGINPGGQVQGFRVDADDLGDEWRNRLLPESELSSIGVRTRQLDS